MIRYLQRPGVSATDVDGDIFLVDPDSEEVFYLNALASGLWRIVHVPATLAEAQATVRAAFPDRPADELDRDVAAALEVLLARGFVINVP
ncbi:MAG: PqqD family protein [Alphaproteobacteria bacterium]